METPQKTELWYDPAIPLLIVSVKKKKKTLIQKGYLQPDVQSSMINIQYMEAT